MSCYLLPHSYINSNMSQENDTLNPMLDYTDDVYVVYIKFYPLI